MRASPDRELRAGGPLRPIPYGDVFTAAEWARLVGGLVPRAMEDKWSIHGEGDTVFLRRSWTDQLFYQVSVRLRRGRARVSAAHRVDVADGPSSDDFYHADLLRFLSRCLVLGEEMTFPLPWGEDSHEGVLQHHVAGTGLPERVVARRALRGWLWRISRGVLRGR